MASKCSVRSVNTKTFLPESKAVFISIAIDWVRSTSFAKWRNTSWIPASKTNLMSSCRNIGLTSRSFGALADRLALWRIGPHCIKIIGCSPSRRIGVAVRPNTNLALVFFKIASKDVAPTWWHSSTIIWPYFSTSGLTTPWRETDCITAMSILPDGLDLPPPIVPIMPLPTSKKPLRRSCHCLSNSVLCTRINVLTPRREMIEAAATVLPNAVGAHSTPMSCVSIWLTASSWSGRNCPVKITSSGWPENLSSINSQ